MFQLPFYIFLFIYLLIIFIAVIIFYISYHHVHSTGTLRGGALFTTLVLGGLFILVVTTTLVSLHNADWSEATTIGNADWLKGITFLPQ